MPSVIVIGGGIGGLTAAHELVDRGFDVAIYDMRRVRGGKARSLSVPGTGTGGRADLPGEHGFRFFPGCYKHLPDSMAKIPRPGGGTVLDNLVDARTVLLARYDKPGYRFEASIPDTPLDWFMQLYNSFRLIDKVGLDDVLFFTMRLFQVATSCQDRRLKELEAQSWWDFVGAATRSTAYQQFMAEGLSRSLVAAQAKLASARTIGQVQVALAETVFTGKPAMDRVLNGPTNDVFLNPWIDLLKEKGVPYHNPYEILAIECDGETITGVRVAPAGQPEAVQHLTADYYVAAIPIERMAELVTPALKRANPAFEGMLKIAPNVRWMNGIQFYLKTDVRVNDGHTLYLSTPWALTSVSQAQFWVKSIPDTWGDGTVKGILSVDISEWLVDGDCGQKKPAKACTAEEIAMEVWAELKRSLNVGGVTLLDDTMLHSWFLDPDIEIKNPPEYGETTNLEPLFVNFVNSWPLRPTAATAIPNLVLASDYVQCESDLACMETANEAGRRAVNAILATSGSNATPCTLFPMDMPALLKPLRDLDQIRFDLGLPWTPFGIGDLALVEAGHEFHELAHHLAGDLERDAAAALHFLHRL